MRISFAVLATLLAAPAFAQTGTLDQQSPMSNVSFNGNLIGWDRAQNAQVGVAGTLEGIEFEVWGLPTVGATVNIYGPNATQGPPTGAPAASFYCFGGGGGWVTTFVDMSAANLQFQVGDFFIIEWIGSSPGIDFKGNAGFPSALYPYEFWETGGSGSYMTTSGTTKLGFNSYMLPLAPPGPTIALTGACPGPATVQMTNMTAGGLVGLGYSRNLGNAVIPTGGCAGTVLDLAGPTLLTQVVADGQGAANFQGNIPVTACGNVHLQALDFSSCETSNLLAL